MGEGAELSPLLIFQRPVFTSSAAPRESIDSSVQVSGQKYRFSQYKYMTFCIFYLKIKKKFLGRGTGLHTIPKHSLTIACRPSVRL